MSAMTSHEVLCLLAVFPLKQEQDKAWLNPLCCSALNDVGEWLSAVSDSDEETLSFVHESGPVSSCDSKTDDMCGPPHKRQRQEPLPGPSPLTAKRPDSSVSWVASLGTIFDLPALAARFAKPLKLMTACSGTEAPCIALQDRFCSSESSLGGLLRPEQKRLAQTDISPLRKRTLVRMSSFFVVPQAKLSLVSRLLGCSC